MRGARIDCCNGLRNAPARMRPLLLIVLLCLCESVAFAQAPPNHEIDIRVEKNGPANVVDASFFVPATPQQAWEVLTDWNNLAGFMTNIKASSIVSQSGNTARVKQTGRAKLWPFSFDIEIEREIELFPFEKMQFRLLGGDFDKMEGELHLVAEPAGTRIVSHTESIPKFWIPPLIGPIMIEREMRDQFREIIEEILRRAAVKNAVPEAGDGEKK